MSRATATACSPARASPPTGSVAIAVRTGEGRRYLAAFPVAGSEPDIHRLERFGTLSPHRRSD